MLTLQNSMDDQVGPRSKEQQKLVEMYQSRLQAIKNQTVSYDSNTGKPFTERINHGAEVVASIVVKEYEFKKRHGVTAYLKGFVVYKNGESQSGTDFKSIMENVL